MSEIKFKSKIQNKREKKTKPNYWTEEEDNILFQKAEEFHYKNWNSIANFIPGKSSIQCSARYRRIKPGLIKGPWDEEEDKKLLSLYQKYRTNWAAISKEMPHRTGKQIRDRFLNSLDSRFDRGKFTEEEDKALLKYYKMYGKSWAKIAKKLKTRTGDMIKNRFYSYLKKTLKNRRNNLGKKRLLAQKDENLHKDKEDISPEIKSKNKRNRLKLKKKLKINEKNKENFNFKDTLKIEIENEMDEKKTHTLKKMNNSRIINSHINNNNKNICHNNNSNNNKNKIELIEEENNELGQNISQKISDNNPKKENNCLINNKTLFNVEENQQKKLEPQNTLNYIFDSGSKTNSFNELNDNINKNLIPSFHYEEEIVKNIENLKYLSNFEIESKLNLKEQLDIIFDLESIINQRLLSIQKEIEKN